MITIYQNFMKLGKKLRIIVGWLLAIIILAFLIRLIYIHRAELAKWQWDINWTYAVTSAVLLGTAYIFLALAWRAIIYGFGHCISLKESFRIIYLSQLGRYIPGKVWQVFGMIALAGVYAETAIVLLKAAG